MNKKFYTPKSDYIFKRIFSNKEYLKAFLKELLKEEIEDIEVLQGAVTNKESRQNKYCIFDVIAKAKNKYIHLEMQQKVEADFEERVEYYDDKKVSYLAKAGGNYKELGFELTTIWLVAENIDDTNVVIDKVARVYLERKRVLKSNSEIYIIELAKVGKGKKELENGLWQWLYFLGSERIDETMEKIMEINPIIRKAVESECCFTDEEIEFFESFRQEEADRLWNRDMQKAKEKGIQQGIKRGLEEGLEQGLQQGVKLGEKQGLEKGVKRGVKQGLKQGVQKEKIRIVYNMYKNNFDTATICLVLNLTKEDVENILANKL